MVAKRIGEFVGPVDWDYDFLRHDWNHGGSINPDINRRSIDILRELVANPDKDWRYRGRKVVEIGMYDGWPYWQPTPAIRYDGPLGLEIAFWYNLYPINGNNVGGI